MAKAAINISLARRIWIAIALISLIPIIVFAYYVFGYQISVWAAGFLVLVVFLGWRVVFEVFSSVVRVYAQSRSTLLDIGEPAPEIPDEVQSLETVISLLSDKVKTGFEELQSFTKKTEELNREVTKKVLILSAILQANDLFSKDTPAEEIIRFLSDHLKKLLDSNVCFCGLREDVSSELKAISFSGVSIDSIDDFISKRAKDLPTKVDLVVIDSTHQPKHYQKWASELGVINLAIVPVVSKGQVIGMVGVGNNQDSYVFNKDEADVLNLFSQNVTLIWEHQRLSTKIEELEILDKLTGLYNEKTIAKRLDEEIQRSSAYQRPCGLIGLNLVNFDKYQKDYGLIEAEKMMAKVAQAFKKNLRPIDIAGRIASKTLGAILIESNKRHSLEVASKIEAKLAEVTQEKIKLSSAVAESPLDGTTAKELLDFVTTKSEK